MTDNTRTGNENVMIHNISDSRAALPTLSLGARTGADGVALQKVTVIPFRLSSKFYGI